MATNFFEYLVKWQEKVFLSISLNDNHLDAFATELAVMPPFHGILMGRFPAMSPFDVHEEK